MRVAHLGLELGLVGRAALDGEQIVQGGTARWLGRVSDDENPADLYRAATVVAVPSLDEGFGLPILEAKGRAGWHALRMVTP